MRDYLPDIFNKNSNSNISKLMNLMNNEIDSFVDLTNKVEIWRSIDEAEGKALDLLGENVGQLRGKASDEVYRILIRGKIARNYCDGSIDRILRALSISLQCDPSEIHIVNGYETMGSFTFAKFVDVIEVSQRGFADIEGTTGGSLSTTDTTYIKAAMASIIIKKIPIAHLNRFGMSITQFAQLAQSIVAAGVSIDYINVEGTFSFSSSSSTVEISSDGFADVDETTGGTLGGVFKPSNDYKLPI